MKAIQKRNSYIFHIFIDYKILMFTNFIEYNSKKVISNNNIHNTLLPRVIKKLYFYTYYLYIHICDKNIIF